MNKKVVLRTVCAVLGTALLLARGYGLYVVLRYYRVEDQQSVTVAGAATQSVPVGEPLSLITYNIGFGAYSQDYSFFMDGG